MLWSARKASDASPVPTGWSDGIRTAKGPQRGAEGTAGREVRAVAMPDEYLRRAG
jgi:hypothetical protein